VLGQLVQVLPSRSEARRRRSHGAILARRSADRPDARNLARRTSSCVPASRRSSNEVRRRRGPYDACARQAEGERMTGHVSYGAYGPDGRLQRGAIAAALGQGGGKGTRSVASYDEDTTSMGVEAARIALRQAPEGVVPSDVVFATTAPTYLDKTNATAIHAALALPAHAGAYDVIGSVRSNVA